MALNVVYAPSMLVERVSYPPTSPSQIIKRRINEAIDRKWEVMWRNHSQCTSTKLFLPTLDRNRQKLLKELPRGSLAFLTQIVTGHTYFQARTYLAYVP